MIAMTFKMGLAAVIMTSTAMSLKSTHKNSALVNQELLLQSSVQISMMAFD